MMSSGNTRMERALRAVALLGFGAIVLLAGLTMTDAILRHLGLPRIPGFNDVNQVLLAVLIASSLPIGLLRQRHIRIDLVGKRWGKHAHRGLELFASVIVLVVMIIIAIELLSMTLDLQRNGRTTSTIRMPIAPWWWLTSALVCLCIPAQLAVILRIWRRREA